MKGYKFYYLIDLHYSQTGFDSVFGKHTFYYLIDLHYSQTQTFCNAQKCKFYYLIDLHYSQTCEQIRLMMLRFTTL